MVRCSSAASIFASVAALSFEAAWTASCDEVPVTPIEAVTHFCSNLHAWLHAEDRFPPRGYHVLCIRKATYNIGSQGPELTEGLAWVFRNGSRSGEMIELGPASSWAQFRRNLEQRVRLVPQPRWEVFPWRVYSDNRAEVNGVQEIQSGSMLLVFEGGDFMWPAVCKGYERTIDVGLQKSLVMKTFLVDPVAFVIDSFLSDAEMEALRKLGEPLLVDSGVSKIDGFKGDAKDIRSSSQVFLPVDSDPVLANVSARAKLHSRLHGHQEHIQILRYQRGQLYQAHTDYFAPRNYIKQPNFVKELTFRQNRILTSFLYLVDVPEGGETAFPRAMGAPPPKQLRECSEWTRVAPQKGRALFFYSLHADASLNPSSLHVGCPPKGNSEKWTANIWTWNTPKDWVLIEPKHDPEIAPAYELLEKGGKKMCPGNCSDEHEMCGDWAATGECESNEESMRNLCKCSCGFCPKAFGCPEDCQDKSEHCGDWAAKGECEKNPGSMQALCRCSCGFCPESSGDEAKSGCRDQHEHCAAWSAQGECETNAGFMLESCMRSCDACPEAIHVGVEVSNCTDHSNCCAAKAAIGQCETDPSYMHENCQWSCGSPPKKLGMEVRCRDVDKTCASWAKSGECDKNPGHMHKICAASCNICSSKLEL